MFFITINVVSYVQMKNYHQILLNVAHAAILCTNCNSIEHSSTENTNLLAFVAHKLKKETPQWKGNAQAIYVIMLHNIHRDNRETL